MSGDRSVYNHLRVDSGDSNAGPSQGIPTVCISPQTPAEIDEQHTTTHNHVPVKLSDHSTIPCPPPSPPPPLCFTASEFLEKLNQLLESDDFDEVKHQPRLVRLLDSLTALHCETKSVGVSPSGSALPSPRATAPTADDLFFNSSVPATFLSIWTVCSRFDRSLTCAVMCCLASIASRDDNPLVTSDHMEQFQNVIDLVPFVLNVLEQFSDDIDIVSYVLLVLGNIPLFASVARAVEPEFLEKQGLSHIQKVLETHMEHESVVDKCCYMLANWCISSDKFAASIISLPVLQKLCQHTAQHGANNINLQESVVCLLVNLTSKQLSWHHTQVHDVLATSVTLLHQACVQTGCELDTSSGDIEVDCADASGASAMPLLEYMRASTDGPTVAFGTLGHGVPGQVSKLLWRPRQQDSDVPLISPRGNALDSIRSDCSESNSGGGNNTHSPPPVTAWESTESVPPSALAACAATGSSSPHTQARSLEPQSNNRKSPTMDGIPKASPSLVSLLTRGNAPVDVLQSAASSTQPKQSGAESGDSTRGKPTIPEAISSLTARIIHCCLQVILNMCHSAEVKQADDAHADLLALGSIEAIALALQLPEFSETEEVVERALMALEVMLERINFSALVHCSGVECKHRKASTSAQQTETTTTSTSQTIDHPLADHSAPSFSCPLDHDATSNVIKQLLHLPKLISQASRDYEENGQLQVRFLACALQLNIRGRMADSAAAHDSQSELHSNAVDSILPLPALLSRLETELRLYVFPQIVAVSRSLSKDIVVADFAVHVAAAFTATSDEYALDLIDCGMQYAMLEMIQVYNAGRNYFSSQKTSKRRTTHQLYILSPRTRSPFTPFASPLPSPMPSKSGNSGSFSNSPGHSSGHHRARSLTSDNSPNSLAPPKSSLGGRSTSPRSSNKSFTLPRNFDLSQANAANAARARAASVMTSASSQHTPRATTPGCDNKPNPNEILHQAMLVLQRLLDCAITDHNASTQLLASGFVQPCFNVLNTHTMEEVTLVSVMGVLSRLLTLVAQMCSHAAAGKMTCKMQDAPMEVVESIALELVGAAHKNPVARSRTNSSASGRTGDGRSSSSSGTIPESNDSNDTTTTSSDASSSTDASAPRPRPRISFRSDRKNAISLALLASSLKCMSSDVTTPSHIIKLDAATSNVTDSKEVESAKERLKCMALAEVSARFAAVFMQSLLYVVSQPMQSAEPEHDVTSPSDAIEHALKEALVRQSEFHKAPMLAASAIFEVAQILESIASVTASCTPKSSGSPSALSSFSSSISSLIDANTLSLPSMSKNASPPTPEATGIADSELNMLKERVMVNKFELASAVDDIKKVIQIGHVPRPLRTPLRRALAKLSTKIRVRATAKWKQWMENRYRFKRIEAQYRSIAARPGDDDSKQHQRHAIGNSSATTSSPKTERVSSKIGAIVSEREVSRQSISLVDASSIIGAVLGVPRRSSHQGTTASSDPLSTRRINRADVVLSNKSLQTQPRGVALRRFKDRPSFIRPMIKVNDGIVSQPRAGEIPESPLHEIEIDAQPRSAEEAAPQPSSRGTTRHRRSLSGPNSRPSRLIKVSSSISLASSSTSRHEELRIIEPNGKSTTIVTHPGGSDEDLSSDSSDDTAGIDPDQDSSAATTEAQHSRNNSSGSHTDSITTVPTSFVTTVSAAALSQLSRSSSRPSLINLHAELESHTIPAGFNPPADKHTMSNVHSGVSFNVHGRETVNYVLPHMSSPANAKAAVNSDTKQFTPSSARTGRHSRHQTVGCISPNVPSLHARHPQPLGGKRASSNDASGETDPLRVTEWWNLLHEAESQEYSAAWLRQHPQTHTLLQSGEGFPSSLRSRLWMILSGAADMKQTFSPTYYSQLCAAYQHLRDSSPLWLDQIRKDVKRTNADKFATQEARDVLERVLSAYVLSNPEAVGYCQGMNIVCGALLSVMTEEGAFWVLSALISSRMGYYARSMCGLKVDQRALQDIVQYQLPKLDDHMVKHDVFFGQVTISWFICLMMNTPVPTQDCFRVWDFLLVYGDEILFLVTLQLLRSNRTRIMNMDSGGDILQLLHGNSLLEEIDIRQLLSSIRPGSLVEHIEALREWHKRDVLEEEKTLDNSSLAAWSEEYGFHEEEISRIWNSFLSPAPWAILLTHCVGSSTWFHQSFSITVFPAWHRQRWRACGLFSGVFKRLFELADSTDTGAVSWEQYLSTVYVFTLAKQDEKLLFCFRFFDFSGTHQVTQANLEWGLTMLHELYNGQSGENDAVKLFTTMLCERAKLVEAQHTRRRNRLYRLVRELGSTNTAEADSISPAAAAATVAAAAAATTTANQRTEAANDDPVGGEDIGMSFFAFSRIISLHPLVQLFFNLDDASQLESQFRLFGSQFRPGAAPSASRDTHLISRR
jgi:Rab-GTPase-TBC domain